MTLQTEYPKTLEVIRKIEEDYNIHIGQVELSTLFDAFQEDTGNLVQAERNVLADKLEAIL